MPTKATLNKYNLTQDSYDAMLKWQHGMCPICERPFNDERTPVIDHEHVKNFKKLVDRHRYVRGLLCTYCNFRRIPKGFDSEMALRVYNYLKKYEDDSRRLDRPQGHTREPI